MEGKKFDSGKAPMSLVPHEFVLGIAKVLKFGAQKYDAWNWAQGMDWNRPLDALYRHVGAWEGGNNIDEETGLNHLLHAACCLMFLYMYQLCGLGKDNRWKRNPKSDEKTSSCSKGSKRCTQAPTDASCAPKQETYGSSVESQPGNTGYEYYNLIQKL
jgi:hypothetical protein